MQRRNVAIGSYNSTNNSNGIKERKRTMSFSSSPTQTSSTSFTPTKEFRSPNADSVLSKQTKFSNSNGSAIKDGVDSEENIKEIEKISKKKVDEKKFIIETPLQQRLIFNPSPVSANTNVATIIRDNFYSEIKKDNLLFHECIGNGATAMVRRATFHYMTLVSRVM